MTAGKPPKKSDVLEVRLPHETKTAFMARCRETRRTASEVVRIFIDQELEGRASKPRRSGLVWRVLAAALAGLAVGATAAPSLARPMSASHGAFDRLDANHDGVLSFAEFGQR
uniref:EF-hand domain-containing protein n=1 Tax=Caulobacter sp. (strain K31) TaxID=366602 RepID=B0T517_CAUSK